jgi:hypothetical protein
MVKRRSTGLIALLVILLMLCACSMIKAQKQKDDFSTKNEDFMLRMKWNKFTGAALHFQKDLREPFLVRFEALEDLRMTDFVVSRTMAEIDGETERVDVNYAFEYYLLSEMKVYKQKIKLDWELTAETDDRDSYWRIMTPFPELEVENK